MLRHVAGTCSIVLALSAVFVASDSTAKEPLKPPFAGHPDCRSSGQYYQAAAFSIEAARALRAGRFSQSRAIAERGISVLGDAYWSDDVPVADDTGMYLINARVQARHGETKATASTTLDMLNSRLQQYLMVWGDPAKLCKR